MCYFVCYGFIAGPFRWAMAVFKFSLFSGKRAKPRERPQKGLKPVWNHSETPSGSPSQTLCSFGCSIIALFCFSFAGKMCYFVCFGFIAGPFRWAVAMFKLTLFSGNRAKPRERPQRVWNRSGTAGNCSPSQTLCLSGPQCLQLEYVLGACFSGPLHVFPDRNVYSLSTFWVLAFPDRCMSFRTAMSTIRVRFGCLLFRTAACLSGPQCLQLEYVLGACFSGPLHVFPDRNVYN